MTIAELPANPFEDNVVFEPREAGPSVRGLNDGPLDLLLGQFARLEAEPPPRRHPLRLKAHLVTSAEPGYGKSHLVGRLFRALRDRATLVYLPPFQDPGSSWRSILLKTVQELHRPRDWRHPTGRAGETTQGCAFACGVIARLLASLIAKGIVAGPEAGEVAAALRADPLGAFGDLAPGHYLTAWMRAEFPGELRAVLIEELQESKLALHAPASAWLKVLHAYAFGSEKGQSAACLDWLKGEGVSEEERALLGLDHKEVPPVEESAAKRNADAFDRMEDLLALAGFYQPFLFCFDQTELFADVPERAAEFGAVIEQLVRAGLNHFTVVTANLEPWTRVIVRNFQTAYLARFTEPIELGGITRPQALLLARQRLTGCGLDEAAISDFARPEWLDEVFRDAPAYGVRTFLRLCAKRCAELSRRRGVILPEKTLADYYNDYESEVRGRSHWLDFDPDILRWSVGPETVGDALAGQTVERFRDPKQYFPIRWKSRSRLLLFGFEDSSQAARWRSILQAARQQATRPASRQPSGTRVIFFRTPNQQPIPGTGWTVIGQELKEARHLLAIHVVGTQDLLTICAAYELYANVLEGNAPFSREEMLGFVRGKLKPWWERLLADPHPADGG